MLTADVEGLVLAEAPGGAEVQLNSKPDRMTSGWLLVSIKTIEKKRATLRT